jgi:hypothetical protein
VLLHPSGAMELRFTKPSFKYKAGQWLFLNVPEVSKFQWHPVSDATASRLTLVHHIVRSRGPVCVGPHSSGRRFHQSPWSASWRDDGSGELAECREERAGRRGQGSPRGLCRGQSGNGEGYAGAADRRVSSLGPGRARRAAPRRAYESDRLVLLPRTSSSPRWPCS